MIRGAQSVFSLQSTPNSFACALQAKFLDYIVKDYGRACRRRLAKERQARQPCVGAEDLRQQPHVESDLGTSVTGNNGNIPAGDVDSATESHLMSFQVDDMHGLTTSPEEWAFLNQDWTTLFTQSGFDLSDGNFVPI